MAGKRTEKSSEEFIQKIKELYTSGSSLEEVATQLNTSRAWVSRKLREAGVKLRQKTGTPWKEHEDAVLIANKDTQPKDLVPLLDNRTVKAITNRRKVLGLCKKASEIRHQWTEEDRQFIRDNPTMTDYAIGKHLGATGSAVKAVRAKLDIYKEYQCRDCGVKLHSKGNYCKQHGKFQKRVQSYMSKARTKERDFSLPESVVYTLLTSNCHYCGGSGYGIDRVDSSKGYVEDNVVPCCTICNVMKNALPVLDFEAHILKLAERIRSRNSG